MENTESTNEELLLTEKEVWDVVAMARAYSGLYGTTYLTPDLISGRMKDITLNPMAATEDMLDTAMTSPKDNEDNLRKFSQNFELTSMVYKRLISYLSNMLSFDITYVSDAEPKDYGTPKYKKDSAAVEKFLDKFDYKKEFHTAVREMLRNDAFFACLFDTGDKLVLQELNPDYCKITGRWEGGLLFSYNMYWFLLPGVDINQYPPFFKKKYKEIFESNTSKGKYYNPGLSAEVRDSSYVYWVDVPATIGVCFKLTPELATRLPYFTPLFSDLLLQPLMRNLQKNANMAAASKMILGEVPLLNRDIKATVKDSIAISPDLLGKFMALVKNSLSEAIKISAAPLVNMKGVEFESDNVMYDSYLKTTLASSGVNTNLIFTSGIKPNTIETQLSLNVDEQMMTALYEQFNLFMNYHANQFTKTFAFDFSFEGTDFFLDRTKRLADAMTLFDKGIVLPQKIAAAMGMKPHHLRKQMEESKAMDFMSMLTPPSFLQQKEMAEINGKQQNELADKNAKNQAEIADKNAKNQAEIAKSKQEGATAGRPRKPDAQLGEEGEATKAQGTNIGRGGKP